ENKEKFKECYSFLSKYANYSNEKAYDNVKEACKKLVLAKNTMQNLENGIPEGFKEFENNWNASLFCSLHDSFMQHHCQWLTLPANGFGNMDGNERRYNNAANNRRRQYSNGISQSGFIIRAASQLDRFFFGYSNGNCLLS
ncbi:MAG: hypothetical protein P8Y30_05305, partial [candidate division WOR-3 bacterium]